MCVEKLNRAWFKHDMCLRGTMGRKNLANVAGSIPNHVKHILVRECH